MSFRRVGGLLATVLATLMWSSCGDIYRPVVFPTNTVPPSPANFHSVFGINTNVAAVQGSAMQIDVSGDTLIGATDAGFNPTHAAILPNNSRVFVSSAAGSLCPAGTDTITAINPVSDIGTAAGLGTPVVITYPNSGPLLTSNVTAITESANLVTVTMNAPLANAIPGQFIIISNVPVHGYNGCFPILTVTGTTLTYANPTTGLSASSGGTVTLPTFCPYLPDYVATSQNSAAFVANYGVEGDLNCNLPATDSITSVSPSDNAITDIQYLPSGTHPIAMAETPDAFNLYVLNQGNSSVPSSVIDLSPTDLSTLATVPNVGAGPVWAVARLDSRRLYIVTQGSGQLVPVDVTSNTVLASQTNLSVGAGANFVLYDPNLNRLYVTNPVTGNVFVFSTSGGLDPVTGTANDTPTLLSTISMTAGPNPPCPNGCSPVSVAALPDGTRFYVASYETTSNCPDPNVGTGSPCIIPRLTVFDAASMTVKPISSQYTLLPPSLSLLSTPQFAASQYALAQNPVCAPAATYVPTSPRFRVFAAAAADSTHVYVSICDAGIVADINSSSSPIASVPNNTPDIVETDIPTPFGACAVAGCGTVAHITSFSITSNIVTFQAINSFVEGQVVAISGLSSKIGVNLNGLSVAVLGTALSGTQFQAVLAPSEAQPNVGPTPDSGKAVPLPTLQTPVFLLAGQ
jgi:DNA-binding beta-propeller fold protein YncE